MPRCPRRVVRIAHAAPRTFKGRISLFRTRRFLCGRRVAVSERLRFFSRVTISAPRTGKGSISRARASRIGHACGKAMPRRSRRVARITVSAAGADISRISAARAGSRRRRCRIAVSERLRFIARITIAANRTGIDGIASRRTSRQCNFRNISMPFLARVYRRDRIGRSIPCFIRSTKIEKSLRLCGLNVCSRRICFPYRG